MSGPVGHMEYPHGVNRGSQVLWRHHVPGESNWSSPTTVLTVIDTKRITVEGAQPFYFDSRGEPSDFTHVVLTFDGLPFPCLFGPDTRLLGWSETFHSSD